MITVDCICIVFFKLFDIVHRKYLRDTQMNKRTSIVKAFENVDDYRIDRCKKHKLIDILVITVCAMICKTEGWEDIELFGKERIGWLKTFLELPNGIPSHDTFRRVFERIDPKQLQDALVSWSRRLYDELSGKVVAIDGKTLCHSFDSSTGKSALHLISAWVEEKQIMLGQRVVDGKTNEITQIPKLLDMLELAGAIVTIDAMGCQKKIARKIVEDSHADYVLALKNNHSTLHHEVAAMFRVASQRNYNDFNASIHQEIDKGHGRIETRTCTCIEVRTWLDHVDDEWTGLRTVVRMDSTREIGEKKSTETRYYISSLECDAKLISGAVRSHWGIENSLHWVLDVVFREDDSRIRKGHAPENLAVARRVALNLIKLNKPERMSAKKAQLKATLNPEFAAGLFTGF